MDDLERFLNMQDDLIAGLKTPFSCNNLGGILANYAKSYTVHSTILKTNFLSSKTK
jgi:hypothetical protein